MPRPAKSKEIDIPEKLREMAKRDPVKALDVFVSHVLKNTIEKREARFNE